MRLRSAPTTEARVNGEGLIEGQESEMTQGLDGLWQATTNFCDLTIPPGEQLTYRRGMAVHHPWDAVEHFARRLRWEPLLAGLAASSVTLAMPEAMSIGPRWLLPVVIIVMLIPTIATHHMGHHSLNHTLGILTTSIMTAALCGSLFLLVHALPKKTESPTDLLTSALLLWLSNILVFALWHWRLDGGGPITRHRRAPYGSRWFLFPQLQIESGERKAMGAEKWTPSFVDYLFVAFNTSTAFSPTDTLVLSPWAKFLTMLQAGISLTILVLLVARGINVL